MIQIYKLRGLYAGTHPDTRGLVMEFKGISGMIHNLPQNISKSGKMLCCDCVIQSAEHWWRDTLSIDYVRETFQQEMYK